MHLHKVGEKSRAICPFCKTLRTATFAEREVPLSSGTGSVPDLLVAVCDVCDHVVGIPQQSVPRIQETLRKTRHPLEARVPRHLLDAAGLVCQALGAPLDCTSVVFRYYVARFARSPALRRRLPDLARSEDAKGRAGARVSMKLNDEISADLRSLEAATHLRKASLVRGLFVQMKRDVLDEQRKDVRRELQTLLRVAM